MNLLKKAKNFVWDEDYKEVFRKLKVTLVTPPILSKSDTSKKLIIYLSILVEARSIVLV